MLSPKVRRIPFLIVSRYVPRSSREIPANHQHTLATESPPAAAVTDKAPNGLIAFDDYKTVFEFKTTPEIVRALFVLKLCSIDGIVNNGEKLMNVSRKLLGNRVYTAVQKKTIYGQFVGGDNLQELMTKVDMLRKGGIGPLLAVPMEDDDGGSTDIEKIEHQFDQNMNKTISCLGIVSDLKDRIPMMQIKLTALIPGNLCTKLTTDYLKTTGSNRGAVEDFAEYFRTNKMPNIKQLNNTENMQLEAGLKRLKKVCEIGKEKGIWLMVDAEYTYMNPALNLFSLALMLNYNYETPVVAYTYQNYLKNTDKLLESDMKYILSQGLGFSAKLVRGAYIDKEKMLADKHGYPCPINDSYEDTSDTYHRSLNIILGETRKSGKKLKTIVASHNENTVLYAVERLKDLEIDPNDETVVFGQVDGMGDQISYALGRSGYLVYKSIPYGSIDDTLPYLLRRLLENRSVLNGVRRERNLLRSTFRHRVKQKIWPS